MSLKMLHFVAKTIFKKIREQLDKYIININFILFYFSKFQRVNKIFKKPFLKK